VLDQLFAGQDCQTAITEKIIERGGDYVLAVKDNQPTLNEEVQQIFQEPPAELKSDCHEEITKDHGRIESRCCRQIEINSEWLPDGERWRGIKSVVEILSRREMSDGTVTEETRYFISSLEVDAKKALNAVRSHWLIENSLHWSLDMSYREDECRIRRQNGAEFFTVLRRLSLNIIKKDQSKKAGISRKRKMAARNTDYLMQLIRQFQTA
jgi:predicted transposase YbfD/YdcC